MPSNIAEGHGRHGPKEFAKFLWIANGSLSEIQTQTILAEKLGYTSINESEVIIQKANEVGRLITGLRKSLTTT